MIFKIQHEGGTLEIQEDDLDRLSIDLISKRVDFYFKQKHAQSFDQLVSYSFEELWSDEFGLAFIKDCSF